MVIVNSVQEIPELEVFGDPFGPIVSVKSSVLNVAVLGEIMQGKGWHFIALQNPHG